MHERLARDSEGQRVLKRKLWKEAEKIKAALMELEESRLGGGGDY